MNVSTTCEDQMSVNADTTLNRVADLTDLHTASAHCLLSADEVFGRQGEGDL